MQLQNKGGVSIGGKVQTCWYNLEMYGSTTAFLNKVYLGTAQGEFKKRFCNFNKSFKNKSMRNYNTLAKYSTYCTS